MTPEQLIWKKFIECGIRDGDFKTNKVRDEYTIDELWEEFTEQDLQWDLMWEVREGEVETDISAPTSRHYESKSVAAEIDNKWVGWTYWYGGGKHGEPQAIEWMEDAYFLDCKEEEKVIIVRTFTKKGE